VLSLIDLARRVLLVQAAAGGHAGGSAVAEALDGIAARLETGAALHPADLRSQDGEFILRDMLVERVEVLQRAAA
jgi:NAD(P)H-dependent FMN reductase